MFMNLPEVNMMAVLAASVVYFFIGWVWYAVLFKNQWMAEMASHGMKKSSQEMMMKSMVFSFLTNFVTALAMAYLVVMTGAASNEAAVHLGLIAGLGLAATSIANVFVWENRSLRFFLIDAGYMVIGIVAASVVLSMWQ